MSESPSPIGIGRERQSQIYVDGARGVRPKVPVSLDRLEARARRAMTAEG